MASKHIKMYSISQATKEMQSKTSMRYNCTSKILAKLKQNRTKQKPVNTGVEQSGKA